VKGKPAGRAPPKEAAAAWLRADVLESIRADALKMRDQIEVALPHLKNERARRRYEAYLEAWKQAHPSVATNQNLRAVEVAQLRIQLLFDEVFVSLEAQVSGKGGGRPKQPMPSAQERQWIDELERRDAGNDERGRASRIIREAEEHRRPVTINGKTATDRQVRQYLKRRRST